MIRFPNPGSNISQLITIFQELYQSLHDMTYFTLDDMSKTLTKTNLAASCGYVGERALVLSTRDNRSRDPLYNQSKMYAELFRSLGWIGSTQDSALNYTFTLLGAHAAVETDNSKDIFEESILGINYPNQVINTQFPEASRVFANILHTANELNGYICRDELIIGPLSNNDITDENFASMIERLQKIRGNFGLLQDAIYSLSSQTGIQVNTLNNYTRFPIAVLIYCGWFEKIRTKDCYKNRSMVMLKLTPKGYAKERKIRDCLDIRVSDYERIPKSKQPSLIGLGFYSMLERSNFDISPVASQLQKDWDFLYSNSEHRDIIFSPYQTINLSDVNAVLNPIDIDSFQNSTELGIIVKPKKKASESIYSNNNTTSVKLMENRSLYEKNTAYNCEITEKINNYYNQKISINEIINKLFMRYRDAKKEIFYPLIADLFSIIGFNCRCPRNGINYERWDAIIDDDKKSIPIEIKSPTEEEFISVKAVRQALENKVILLSRGTYHTDWDTVSLIVGYNMPNDRAEVAKLIHDIKRTFGLKIGVIDFKSLLLMATLKICENKMIKLSDIEQMEELIDVRFT